MIRPVEKSDVAAVIDLVRTTLGEFGIVFGEGAETDAQLEQLPESYTANGGAFFVAIDGGQLVGTAGIALVAPGLFELRKMYLRPEARGRGTGQLLFDACLAHARAHGGTRMPSPSTSATASSAMTPSGAPRGAPVATGVISGPLSRRETHDFTRGRATSDALFRQCVQFHAPHSPPSTHSQLAERPEPG